MAIAVNLDDIEREYLVAVLNAIAAARDAPGKLAELVEAITEGRAELSLSEAIRVGVLKLVEQSLSVYVAVGSDVARQWSASLNTVVEFNPVNERAVSFMRDERLRLIREFADEQRRATRLALTDGITRGLNPVEQARAFRGSIGLTQRQQQSVLNYRTYLERAALGDTTALNRSLRDRRFDATVRRAVRTREPLSSDQITRMTERYRQRYVGYRARVIARTEALRSVHVAQDEATEQAIEEGHIGREEIERTWITTIDGRERSSHAMLNGMVRGKDEPFPGLAGPILFPGDPAAAAEETIQCRCTLAITVASASKRVAVFSYRNAA